MSSPLLPSAYRELIEQDIKWLEEKLSKDDKEDAFGPYQNIVDSLRYCLQMYDEYGYMEQMKNNNA